MQDTIEAIEELAEWKQWVMWKSIDGKKRPFAPSGIPIGATLKYEKRWVSYEAVQEEFEQGRNVPSGEEGGWDGIGFVFTEDDPFVGVDIDKCRDPETGALTQNAQEIIKELNSYTEASPSGTGVHIICRGNHIRVGHNPRGKNPVEMYSWGRYFTVNGEHIAGTPSTIEDRHEALAALEKRLYGKSKAVEKTEWEGIDFQISRNAKPPKKKLDALLAGNIDFRKTWNHTRDDMADKSMSEMDAACARMMIEDRWEPHEVAAGIIQHRSDWCKGDDFEKAMRVDYIGRTWAWANACVQEGIDEDEYLIKQTTERSGGDDALHQVSSRLGIMVTRVIRLGGTPSDYILRVDGKEVRIGSAAAMRNWARTADAIWDVTGKNIKRMKTAKWDQVLGLIGAAAENRAVPGSGRVDEVLEVVEAYMEARDVDTKDILLAFYERLPFKDDGYVYLHKSNFKEYIDVRTNLKLRPSEVGKILIEGGWEPYKKTMAVDKEGNVCRQLFRRPLL